MKISIVVLFLVFSSLAIAEKIVINSLNDLKKCSEKHSWDTGVCFEAFEKFVEKNPKQTLAAAKLGRTIFAEWAVLPVFEKAYKKSKDKGICKDDDFQRSLFNSLWHPESHSSYKIAQKFLKGECGSFLVDRATKELDSYSGEAVISNLCPLLKAHGKSHFNCEPKSTVKETQPVEEILPVLDKTKIKVGLMKAYRGPEGVKVVIAEIKDEKDIFLIYFSGIKGPWHGKTLIYKVHKFDSNGTVDYWTTYNKNSWNSIIVKNCSGGYCQSQLYAPDSGFSEGIRLTFDEEESKKAQAKFILNQL